MGEVGCYKVIDYFLDLKDFYGSGTGKGELLAANAFVGDYNLEFLETNAFLPFRL